MKRNIVFEIYFNPKKYLSLLTCIEQINGILKIQHQYLVKRQDWYLCATSKKKASIYKMFDKDGVTEIGLKKMTQRYNKEKDYFGLPIWDKETEQASLLYILSEGSFGQSFKVYVIIDFRSLEITLDDAQKFCLALSEHFDDAYITVNNNYSEDKMAFPDRLSAAWMIYLPKVQLSHNIVPQAFDVISPTDHEGHAAGSLVVTVPHFFDNRNTDDIKAVRRVDIKLHELGLLPRYADFQR
ncbi:MULTISPECIES: Imm52 family immunity protein [unclassified Snodgrassella]|uniref:Imm52 family immunity protein n=2 Tax=Snodgrassella TaxID=1193515 RepID=UPI0018DBEB8F|nr:MULTISPECIES: Imm52 family immunity protein [unclassified Snodgrassella]MBI0068364.1 immunity 52 family protein [Snodgrassella sp. M0110]MBI0079681.1 immunity 52 family protein [Snodgrassella sp. M0112]